MEEFTKRSLIINGFSYNVELDLYRNVNEGEVIEMYYSLNSETLLGIETIKII